MSQEKYLASYPQWVQDEVMKLVREEDYTISEAMGEVLDDLDPQERYMLTH